MIMLSPIYLGPPYFEKLIWVHYVHINLKKEFQCEISVGFPLLYVYQNIELQAAGGQCIKLGASIHSFPESLQRDEAYKDSKERVGMLSKGFVKVKTDTQIVIHHHTIQNLCSLIFHVQIYSHFIVQETMLLYSTRFVLTSYVLYVRI